MEAARARGDVAPYAPGSVITTGYEAGIAYR
jgi:hypothetical protein